MKRDFEYMSGLIEGFFKQARIGGSLRIIKEQEITGWEVWLQIEFAYYLSKLESPPEWWREYSVDFDRRMEKLRGFCRPDFIIRKRGWREDRYAALEMKQHPDAGHCYNNMMVDIIKMGKAKASSLDIRSLWVLGVHDRRSKPELREMVEKRFSDNGFDPPGDHVLIKYIPRCDFAYTLF